MKLKIETSSKRDKPRNYKHLSQKIHTHFQKYRVFPIILKHIVKLNSLHNVLSNHHVGHLGQNDKAHTRTEKKTNVRSKLPALAAISKYEGPAFMQYALSRQKHLRLLLSVATRLDLCLHCPDEELLVLLIPFNSHLFT